MESYMAASQKVMESSLAESSKRQYEASWKTYVQFCEWHDMDPYGKNRRTTVSCSLNLNMKAIFQDVDPTAL